MAGAPRIFDNVRWELTAAGNRQGGHDHQNRNRDCKQDKEKSDIAALAHDPSPFDIKRFW